MSHPPAAPRTALIVAYYFPPIATSGAMRPLGFCRYLREHGYAVRVIAADGHAVTPALAADGSLARRVPPDVAVERVGHPDPLRPLLRVRDWIVRRAGRAHPVQSDRAAPAVGAKPSRLRPLVDTLVEHLFLFPDPQRAWFRRAVAAALRGPRPDVVFATGGPWTTLLVGRALARRYGVPFIADFRDPWTRNPFRAFRWLVRARSRRLERAICRDASLVIANTDELRAQFAADYPWAADKVAVITNGFDVDAAPATVTAGAGLVPASAGATAEGRCELWHFGTIYGKRTPLTLLMALDALLERDPVATARLHVHFVGAWELESGDPASRLARRLEVAGLVSRTPPVPHDACVDLMRRADALLVIQPDSPLQVPGKIFEYLATGRPLVVIGGEGATAALVRRHQLGQCVPNSAPAIVELLDSWLGGRRRLPAGREHEPFAYRHLARQLAGAFDRAVGAHAMAR